MTAQDVVRTVQRIARAEAEKVWSPALAVVTSLHAGDDKPDYACTVRLRDSGLVLPMVPIATGALGGVALPAEGDLVVVLFVGGDVHAPLVIGRLYDRESIPPKHAPGEIVGWFPGANDSESETVRLAIRTPDGGPRKVELSLGGDVTVTITVTDDQIELAAGEAHMTLAQPGSSDGRAELKVGGSSIVVEQGGNVTITAEGTLELKASEVKIAGDSSVKVTGQTIDLN